MSVFDNLWDVDDHFVDNSSASDDLPVQVLNSDTIVIGNILGTWFDIASVLSKDSVVDVVPDVP